MGSLAAGGAATIGTGAFTSVEADRSVNVAVADDANAYLALSKTGTPNSQDYVTTTNGQIVLNLDSTDNGGSGFNKNAKTRIDDIIQVSNQGTQTVNVWVTIDDGDETDSDTFDDGTLYFYPGDSTDAAINNGEGDNDGDDVLALPPGKSANLGVYVDLDDISDQPDESTTATFNADVDAGEEGSSNRVAGVEANIETYGSSFSPVDINKAFDSQIALNSGSGGSEIQIHGDSGGVENTDITLVSNTEYDFSWEINTRGESSTATLSVSGENTVSVTDNDITDGSANESSTGNPEFSDGVPDQVDIAVNARSTTDGLNTNIKNVTVAGAPVTPSGHESNNDGVVAMELDDIPVPENGIVTVEGQFEFNTSEIEKNDVSGLDYLGVTVAPADTL
jgi:hypothetical protein